MDLNSKIYVSGHNGMVGSSIVRRLKSYGVSQENIVIRDRVDLDLTNQDQVRLFFDREKIDKVFLAAAKVGGIYANKTFPAEFIYQNLLIQANVIDAAYNNGTKRLLFMGSSCIYPKHAQQPIKEKALLTGVLEDTNEPYAIAKIAGIKLCESYNRQFKTDYRSLMPTNLYGIGDNYHPQHSHVIPALIRRFHEAKESDSSEVIVWGSGKPLREFMYVDDLADAAIHIMNLSQEDYKKNTNQTLSHINVGYGEDISILDLAKLIASVIGFDGEIKFDSSKPDGTPKKLLDSSLLNSLGWSASIGLEDGLKMTYEDFKNSHIKNRDIL